MSYFNANELPLPEISYVAWVDVMGIESHMQRSIKSAANFIYKLHVAALESPRTVVSLYPMMDGFYATCQSRPAMEEFLRALFYKLAHLFVSETKPHFRFLARGGLAYGEIYHGRGLSDAASSTLAANKPHRDSIVLGVPVIDANRVERLAPPFGVAIHESARAAAPTGSRPYNDEWWVWFDANYPRDPLRVAIREYFEWYRRNVDKTKYDRGRIMVHEALALRYLDDAF